MKTKTFNLVFASVFALIFLIEFTNATITLVAPTTPLSQTSGSFNFTVLSNENETVTISDIAQISDGSGSYITFELSSNEVVLNTVSNPSDIITVDYVIDSGFDFEFTKTYAVNIQATGTVSPTLTKTIPFAASSFCKYSNPGNLKTTVEDVTVKTGYGLDNKWFVFDTVQVEVKVKNNGADDITDVSLEWGLYDVTAKEWVIEVDEEDNFDLDSKDDQTTTITFTLDDSLDMDLQDLQKGDYIFYVRATGDLDEGDNEGDSTCSSDSETGKLIVDKNFVILSNLKVPEVAQCDSEIQILGDAWNIGSKDQNNVYVNIYNKELGIDEDIEIGDIDSFDSSDFDYALRIPEGLQEKKYYITLTVYDEDDNVYENSDDDKSILNVPLTIQGNCAVAKASVTAVLESGGQAGKPMVVKATITNTGKKAAYYSLNVAGYTGWASKVTLDKNALTLNAGESGEVLLTFDIKKDALGSNLFNLEVLSGSELIVNQPVQVEITKRTWGITGNFLSGDNKYIWGIGLLNLILIILIIVIAVRIARK